MVFCGIPMAAEHGSWAYGLRMLLEAMGILSRAIGNMLLAIALLALAPIAFPLICLLCKLAARSRRLAYLRRMRAADEDF